jgi:hypothetical protein
MNIRLPKNLLTNIGQSNIITAIILTMFIAFIFGFYTLNLEINKPKKPLFAQITIDKVTKNTDKSKKFEHQIVIIRHLGGDPIEVKDISIVVTIYRNRVPIRMCILSGFPWKACVGCSISKHLIKGDQIIDRNTSHYAYTLGKIK